MDQQTRFKDEPFNTCEEIVSFLDSEISLDPHSHSAIACTYISNSTNLIFVGNEMEGPKDSFKMTTKRRRRCRRRPRKHKPGNRKRKSLRFRNRGGARRNIIPRSRLGAPFLSNDMVMAKDGWVFDTSSGKIEFKPEVVREQSQNLFSEGEVPTPTGNRYIPISPERDSNVRLTCFDNDCSFEIHETHPVKSPPSTTCDSGFASPGQDSINSSNISTSYKSQTRISDHSVSNLCDSDEDFKFHMQNFEEDTDQYLRECLMELSRENLEAEYYSNLRRLQSLQSHKDLNNNADLPKLYVAACSTDVSHNCLTEGMEKLQRLTSTVTCQVNKLQQENSQLKQETYHLPVASDT